MSDRWEPQPVGKFLKQIKRPTKVEDGETYPLLGVRWYGEGPFPRETVSSAGTAATSFNAVEPGDFIYNRLFAWKGSFGVVNEELAGSYVSNEFPLFTVDSDSLLVEYLRLLMTQPKTWAQIEIESTGSTSVSRNRWKEEQFLNWRAPFPPIGVQQRIVDLMSTVDAYVAAADARVEAARAARTALLTDLLSTPGEDWVETTLESVCEMQLGKMLSKDRATGPDQAPYLRNANVQAGRLALDDLKTMTFTEADRGRYAIRAGDILVCEGGDPGRAAIVEEDLDGVFFQKSLHRLRATDVNADFLYMSICRAYDDGRIEDLCTNTTIKHLTAEKFKRLRVTIPPRERQNDVVELMREVDGDVSAATEIAASSRELRAALLTDLLSGAHEIPASYDRFLEAA